jgi:hypothetical protein
MSNHDIESHYIETAWALSCGFDDATGYWDATRECEDEDAWQREQFLDAGGDDDLLGRA